MTIDWQELISTSHPDTIQAIRRLLDQHDYEAAKIGLDELHENMANADRRALESQLRRLMVHVLKWRYQSEKRSTSWILTIVNARQEIGLLQEYMPSLDREFIESIWGKTFNKALEGAKAEMNLSRKDTFEPTELTWEDVFEKEYLL
ncbi:MAG: DUF29 domain-containing protein [Bacteroidetes bacterium]|nr:DUF29 domain-containing protein [Fibrella sp.]